MADALFEVLSNNDDPTTSLSTNHHDTKTTLTYLDRLSSLSLTALTTTEPFALTHDSQSLLLSLQALSKRSYVSIAESDTSLSHLSSTIPSIFTSSTRMQTSLPGLEAHTVSFAEKYNRLDENTLLDRRKQLLKLGENVDRLTGMLELPTLLSSVIAASTAAATTTSISAANSSYTTALDLHAHIRRLQNLYPDSALVQSIAHDAEAAMREMTSNIVSSLTSPGLKLAGGMRLVGLLRRLAPDLVDEQQHSSSSKTFSVNQSEGSLGAMFLVCRLSNLTTTLSALEPLQELADQESEQTQAAREKNLWAAGQHTERYLKRFVEVFREQCFASVSMYKSIFPQSLAGPDAAAQDEDVPLQALAKTSGTLEGAELRPQSTTKSDAVEDQVLKLPPALATFTGYVIELLMDQLRTYLPNIHDRGSRESILTQVLYCSASLGRLGGDFSMLLATLEPEDATEEEPEWIRVMKKHREQAGRLELLASGTRPNQLLSAG